MSRSHPRIEGAGDALKGRVVWNPVISLWVTGMWIGGFAGIYHAPSLEHLIVFLATTAATLCFGHSLGMHRRLIHESYQCPLWLERTMVWLGTLVGLGGPLTMIRTHDMRDWAQRQPVCHDYFAHRQPFLRDGWWQMHCRLELDYPPQVDIESRIYHDPFYRFIERTWMLQQLPVAFVLYLIGDWAWVAWGVCLRVAVSVAGHWLIGHFAHRDGHRDWHVHGAGVQGYNIRLAAYATFGESWHNNHHAFPGSANLGLETGQADPVWWMLCLLERIGLVWDIHQPEHLPTRQEVKRLHPHRPADASAANTCWIRSTAFGS